MGGTQGASHVAMLAGLLGEEEMASSLGTLLPGLVLHHLQRSTGGKQKLGAISKMGEHALRRLLIIGGSAVVLHASKRARREAPGSSRCWRASRACW
jgi:hypothetical protein